MTVWGSGRSCLVRSPVIALVAAGLALLLLACGDGRDGATVRSIDEVLDGDIAIEDIVADSSLASTPVTAG